ncbi:MAG: hypothetical protein ACXVRJ_07680 [Gaiellaceae bacterium]
MALAFICCAVAFCCFLIARTGDAISFLRARESPQARLAAQHRHLVARSRRVLSRQSRPLVHPRIATSREVLIRGVLILPRALSVPVARRLILIRPGLILIARGLIAVSQRLLIRPSEIVDADDAGTAAGRACRQLAHISPLAYRTKVTGAPRRGHHLTG